MPSPRHTSDRYRRVRRSCWPSVAQKSVQTQAFEVLEAHITGSRHSGAMLVRVRRVFIASESHQHQFFSYSIRCNSWLPHLCALAPQPQDISTCSRWWLPGDWSMRRHLSHAKRELNNRESMLLGCGVSRACRKTIFRQLQDTRQARRSAFVSGYWSEMRGSGSMRDCCRRILSKNR